MTWLKSLLDEHKISQEKYYQKILKLLTLGDRDMAEKCELLEEELQDLGQSQVEPFVRKVLELLEQKTIDSLLYPDEYSQTISKKKTKMDTLTKSVESCSIDNSGNEEDILEDSDQYDPLSPEEMLQQVFSNIELKSIQSALETCNYNIENAMDLLLNGSVPMEKPKQVCRHFMMGSCYRSDCWFSHDPDALICKFFLKGVCYKGDDCEFSHAKPKGMVMPFTLKRTNKVETVKERVIPELDGFPALGNIPTKQKLNFLTPSHSYNDILKKPVEQTKYQQYQLQQERAKKSIEKLDVGWVSTGDTLASSYFKFRSEAIDVALNRNRLFQR
jgi:hypothetical protein